MKNLLVILLCFFLAACSRVVEPLDVVVSEQKNRLELGNNMSSLDVTDKKIILPKNCCHK